MTPEQIATLVARLINTAMEHLIWASATESKPATILVEAAGAIQSQAAEIARLTDENTDLKSIVVSFGALWATSYANFLGLPEGHIIATHYDILEKAGGRMDSFTRTALGEAQ